MVNKRQIYYFDIGLRHKCSVGGVIFARYRISNIVQLWQHQTRVKPNPNGDGGECYFQISEG